MVFRRKDKEDPSGIDASSLSGSLDINPETQVQEDSEQAFLSIQSVNLSPSDPIRGEDEVDVAVFVEDQSGSSAEWVRGYVIVSSPDFDHHILQKCFYMSPGGVISVDDGDKNNAMDGEFTPQDDTRLNVEVGAFPEGTTCDNIHNDGVKTDGTEVRVETRAPPPPLNTRISEVPEEPTACPGSEVELTFEVANSGEFGAIRTTFINEDIGQKEEKISTAQTAPQPGIEDWTKEFTYTTRLPEGETRGRVKFELEQNPGGFTWTQTGRESVSIDSVEAELQVRNISGPNSACVGGQGTITAEVYNTAPCPATGKAKLVNDFNSEQLETEQFTVPSGGAEPVSFDFELPANANDDIDYEVLSFTQVEGNFEETGDAETTVVAINPELEIIETTVTEFRCVGNPVNVATVLSNPEICPQDARVVITNNKDEERVVLGPKTLEPQTNARFETQLPLPDNAVLADDVEYTVTTQTDIGGTWVTSDDDDDDVEIGKAEFNTTSFILQEFAQPGETVSGELSFENDGECPGTLLVETNLTESFTELVQPNSGASYDFSFDMGVEGQPVDIAVSYQEAQRLQQEVSGLVRVHKTIVIDTEAGYIKIYGGFDNPNTYEAAIQAGDVSGSGLEESDQIQGVLRLARWEGTSSTSSIDIDEVSFSDLQFLNMSTGQPTQWVVDGEIQGVGKSFEYRSFSRSPIFRPPDLPDEDPDLSKTYSPTKRVGTLMRGLRRD